MSRAEGFELHLYCEADHEDDTPAEQYARVDRAEYSAYTKRECYRMARADGWSLGVDNEKCPKHSKRRRAATGGTGEGRRDG